MNPKRLSQLLDAHLEGSLTSAEAEELSRAIVAEPEARRLFWEHAALHGLTQEAARLEWLGTASPEVESKVVRVAWWRWAAPLAAAAAVVFLAVAWWVWTPREQGATNGVAVLSRVVGVEWVEAGAPHSAGTVLAPGALRLKSGAVQVEFYSGARVVVEGPAEFRLVSAKEGFLQVGRLTAHVPAQARGFKIGSTALTVVDWGTDFGVAASAAAPTEVHVFAGKVEVALPAQPTAKHPLASGEAVRWEGGALRNIPANRTAFLGEVELAQRDAAEAQRHYTAWREASRNLSDDAATVAHFTFENQPGWERLLTNHAATASPETHGNIVGCEWVDGRWPGKRALAFRGEGDRVRVMVPQVLAQVTFLAWVRVEALPNGLNTLLAADAEQTGAVRWELTRTGRLRFGLGRDLGHQKLDWEVVESEPVVGPQRLGQWLLLVTTFDGSTVCHYCNGQLVGTGSSFRPPALVIGAADLGNWRGSIPRNLPASMDEFAIFGRVLSQGEVQNYFQLGQP